MELMLVEQGKLLVEPGAVDAADLGEHKVEAVLVGHLPIICKHGFQTCLQAGKSSLLIESEFTCLADKKSEIGMHELILVDGKQGPIQIEQEGVYSHWPMIRSFREGVNKGQKKTGGLYEMPDGAQYLKRKLKSYKLEALIEHHSAKIDSDKSSIDC
mgnify:CR=1 FL=1